MSRQGATAPRNLSLTEELEKLEQSITLTLQEIDSNFSKAHRIVTTSILPLVEQYGEHSRAVWEATKFWKQFFEASANVSLSGYEELASEGDTLATATEESSTVLDSTMATATDAEFTPRVRPRSHSRDRDNTAANLTSTPGDGSTIHGRAGAAEDSLLGEGDSDLSGSTPRPPATKSVVIPPPSSRPQFANLGSPYEDLKRELKSEADIPDGAAGLEDEEEEDTEALFQQHTARLPRMSMTPRSSLPGGGTGLLGTDDDDLDYDEDDDTMAQQRGRNKDRLLHRVLDKNYRLMATPLKGGAATGVSPLKWKVTTKDKDKGKWKETQVGVPSWQDDPMSSPEMAVPQLRSAAFMSPMRAVYRHKYEAAAATSKAPRTPGVSVQTPGFGGGRKTKDVFGDAGAAGGTKAAVDGSKKFVDEITWDSDSDDGRLGGMSPPKTIQFALPPSKLLQTPAREASKRIVDDILLTAGEELDEPSEYSPTVVKMNADLDDTF